ncbi:hypothetical protein COCSADRAFT_171645 [Bipolaris sorokiniana ND90Pr]|uniref:Deoxyribonuclease NucA/NucB domain-containing protein n=1 Tax=Cochliobolus sativus (strain ND90Pr / ATCC 201652) TaxID=665912 RepID=M2T2V7_COCSN|nr:uncharacterized protein COCSADRAFT_171645 [Bipolaris sorokiniana ND90Pr]EMD63372.1 hypothetical protein COCSADRAFT_171645 [Bipolaris sorokiniana ND90Pr]
MHFPVLPAVSLVFFAAGIVHAVSFDWDCTNSLGTCNNACYVVNHGLTSGTLTYDANKANRSPRRTASGCNRRPCTNTNYNQWGNSCDEYPFASTHEGGAGTILRCVVDTDNHSEGGQLGNFYKTINDGDHTFCDTLTANDDGSEFRLVNGAFQNVKLRRNMGFMDAVSRVSGKKFREFEDKSGRRLLLLNQDATGDFVGTQVFSDGNMITITKEII